MPLDPKNVQLSQCTAKMLTFNKQLTDGQQETRKERYCCCCLCTSHNKMLLVLCIKAIQREIAFRRVLCNVTSH